MAAACGQVHYSAGSIELQELFLFHGRGGTPGRPPPLSIPFRDCGEDFAAPAASYFAHGGSSSQSPLHAVSAWRRTLGSFPCSSSSRRTRFAGLRREQRGIGQSAPGDGSGWTLCVHIRLPYPLWPFGPSPPDRGSRPRTPFTRVTPLGGQYPSGAQNLSGFPRFPPGHWALGVQKLPLVRFSFRAWVSELMWLGGYRRRGGS